ncbi:MAG: EAL domain-containing protein [Candidatus Dactylopiibacterium sp.]|nr:EAL domain-containing protein [Candidatus Dactylopiibacterium sp.]
MAEYQLLDTSGNEDFERLAKLAARLFDVPIALVTLVERDRQYFKAHVGIDICETTRDVSFCAHAITGDDILLVLDALKDARFSSNPHVIGPPFVRFYAGKPLVTPTGEKLGTVCIIDTEAHETFTEKDAQNLSDLAALVMDRLEIRRLHGLKTTNQARFDNIAATSPDAIICSNTRGGITFWNRSAEKLFGYSFAELENKSSTVIIPESWRHLYEIELERLHRGQQLAFVDQTLELSGLHKDGTEFPAEFSLSSWREGNTVSVGAIVRDITERRHHEERLFRLASLDPLTSLPNRGAWRDCLSEALAAEKPVTVMLLDLDSFKDVNDTLGHSAGDTVLQEVAARLKRAGEGAIKLARLGGDEFALLLPGNDVRKAHGVAELLVASLSQPYEFAGQMIEIGASVGISLAPTHSNQSDELLSAADLALYRAKAEGRGRHEIFTPAFREVAVARRAFERELRLAFENGEFELFYQPQINSGTGQLTGAEALLRWQHPERGLLPPASFIDVLSQKPSAAAVGEWILRSACREAAQWQARIPDFRIGVNLFAAQLRSGRLLTAVQEVLAETGLPARSLELEIVENILLHNDPATLKLLHGLRELGVGLAFDDYGTGFASLSLLKRFPVSRLKIDRSFIRDVTTDPEDAAVVRAVIYLSQQFGLEVIAEGVETQEQREFLMQNRCAEMQGYLFSRPLPAAQFSAAFLKEDVVP